MTANPNSQEPTLEETSAELLDGLKACRSVVENYKSLLDPTHAAILHRDGAANDESEATADD